MAIKFSQFNLRTESTPTMYLVGYDGNQNIHITVDNLISDIIDGTENTIAMFGPGGNKVIDSMLSQNAGATLLTVGGQLNVDGAATFDTSITVTGDSTLNGNVTLGNASDDLITQTGTLYLQGIVQDTNQTSGAEDQILVSDAGGLLNFQDLSATHVESAEVIKVPVKNLQGSGLTKGDPVYISGSVGESGKLEVKLADASNSAKMPAVGLLFQDLGINGEGYVVITGKLRNLTTDPIDGLTPLANDVIYVKAGGVTGDALTLTKPTGSNLIQNMGKVGRVSPANSGNFVVSSILRTNDIPNLTPGKIWVGSTGNTIESSSITFTEATGAVQLNEYGVGTHTGTVAKNLAVDASGNVIETSGNIIDGSGTANYLSRWTDADTLGDSGFYQVNLPGVPLDRAIGLNTTKLDSVFGERPDLRIASREINDPGVLDLFRPDGDVLAGDRVGVLQYSLDDDNQYTVAQIEVKTIGDSGSYNGGGGKLYFKTSTNVTSANPTERLSISNTEADFSVPINVTSTSQSSFAGQIEANSLVVNDTALISDKLTMEDDIDMTNNGNIKNLVDPVDAQDAATKSYVDSQSGGGGVSGSGTTNTLPIWLDGPNGVLSDSLITQTKIDGGTIFDLNAITTGPYTPAVNTKLLDLNSGSAKKFSITQDGGGGVILPSGGGVTNPGPSFNMGGGAFSNGKSGVAMGSTTTAFGNGSLAANFLTLASGGGASAFGLLTEASALASAAFGNKSIASGNYSIAAGQDSIASGQSSVTIGEKGVAQGQNAFVSGFGGTATANNAVKFGYEGSASGNNSAKFGFESVASGANSLAIGNGTTASAFQSIATGNNNVVSGNDSFIGGKNSTVTSASSILYGQGSSVGSNTSAAFGQSNTITANSLSSFVAGDSNNTNTQGQVKLLGSGLIASTQFGVYLGRLNDNTDTFNRFQIGNGTAGRSNALSINGAGYIKIPTYGSGAVTGTATRNLSVDADGKIIETAIGGNTNYSVQVLTANATGQKNYLYVLQGSSAIELTLPSSPSSGDSIKVSNLTTVTTCTINPGSEKIMSIPQIMTLDNNKAAFELIYVGPAYGWVIVGATGEI
jgi:hypothetical protein